MTIVYNIESIVCPETGVDHNWSISEDYKTVECLACKAKLILKEKKKMTKGQEDIIIRITDGSGFLLAHKRIDLVILHSEMQRYLDSVETESESVKTLIKNILIKSLTAHKEALDNINGKVV